MYRSFGKRMIDVCLSAAGLVTALPVLLAAAVAVKLDSPGPVFFRQVRMGLNGRPFSLLKFRTMRVAAATQHQFTPGNVSRITPAGRFLRQTKLDELPQLWNVLAGDMSLVGPRPEVLQYKDFYCGPYADVLRVRPGITDPASIKYRNEEELLSRSRDPQRTYAETVLPDKLGLALRYVREGITFKGDVKIILQTVSAVLERSP